KFVFPPPARSMTRGREEREGIKYTFPSVWTRATMLSKTSTAQHKDSNVAGFGNRGSRDRTPITRPRHDGAGAGISTDLRHNSTEIRTWHHRIHPCRDALEIASRAKHH